MTTDRAANRTTDRAADRAAEKGPEPGHRIHEWGPWALFGLAVAILVFGAWMRRHSIDDAFINYRIVHQIEAGNGPVFNAGERIEAFTSPLWLGILTLADLILPIRLEWIGMLGGILLGAVGIVLAGFGSRHLLESNDESPTARLVLPVGALVLAAFPPIYRLIATGLEDGLTVAWMGSCVWALSRWVRSDRRLGLGSALLIGMGVLVRPDLAPIVAVLLVAVVIGDRTAGWKRNLAMLSAAAVIPVITQVLRMGYFGLLTPNTAIAKSASLARWGKGWQYLTNTLVPYGFWVPLLALTLIGYVPLLRRWQRSERSTTDERVVLVAAAFLLSSLLSTLYIVRVGGDYMQTRLLLPAILSFVLPVSFVSMPNLRSRQSTDDSVSATSLPSKAALASAGLFGIVVVWIVVCGLFIRTESDNTAVLFEARNAVTLNDFQATSVGPLAPPTRPGRVTVMYRQTHYPSARGHTPIVVELGVGKASYALSNNVYVLDALGLANPIAAHEKLRVRGYPGHEKLLTPPWIAALAVAAPTPVAESDFPRPPPISGKGLHVVLVDQGDAQGRSFDDRLATARGVLRCGTVERLLAASNARLTWRRFASNILHAPANQRVEISGEPALAAKDVCTAGERAVLGRSVQHASAN